MGIDRSGLTLSALETWPTATTATLTPEDQDRFRQRCVALQRLAQGTPIAEIVKDTGVARSQLYHLVRRALEVHPDGRLYGFRALLPHLRVKQHARIARSIIVPKSPLETAAP